MNINQDVNDFATLFLRELRMVVLWLLVAFLNQEFCQFQILLSASLFKIVKRPL